MWMVYSTKRSGTPRIATDPHHCLSLSGQEGLQIEVEDWRTMSPSLLLKVTQGWINKRPVSYRVNDESRSFPNRGRNAQFFFMWNFVLFDVYELGFVC